MIEYSFNNSNSIGVLLWAKDSIPPPAFPEVGGDPYLTNKAFIGKWTIDNSNATLKIKLADDGKLNFQWIQILEGSNVNENSVIEAVAVINEDIVLVYKEDHVIKNSIFYLSMDGKRVMTEFYFNTCDKIGEISWIKHEKK